MDYNKNISDNDSSDLTSLILRFLLSFTSEYNETTVVLVLKIIIMIVIVDSNYEIIAKLFLKVLEMNF